MLFDRWTPQGILDEADLIEVFQVSEIGDASGDLSKNRWSYSGQRE